MSIRLGKNVIAGYTENNNYTNLINKPRINNITLDEEVSLDMLGIQPVGNYVTREGFLDVLKEVDGLSVPNYSEVANVKLPYTSEKSGILICNLTLDKETIVYIYVDGNEVHVINNFGLTIAPTNVSLPLKENMTVTMKIDGSVRYYTYKFIPY